MSAWTLLARVGRVARPWSFALIPAIGLGELGAHFVQIHSVVPVSDWEAARVAVDAEWKPGDLVVFEPSWAEPLGREYFGDKLAGVEDVARPDETRFPRAFEISIRGFHAPELSGWARKDRRDVGAITITRLDNPTPVHVADDLLGHVRPGGMHAAQVDATGEVACTFTHGSATSGNLGAPPAVPADRFMCPGGTVVGVSVIRDATDRPRRCILASPPSAGALRITFDDVAFGTSVHGHLGNMTENDRDRSARPVTVVWTVSDRILGKVAYNPGDNWKEFELPTDEVPPRGELVVELSSPRGGRQFCFEADTR